MTFLKNSILLRGGGPAFGLFCEIAFLFLSFENFTGSQNICTYSMHLFIHVHMCVHNIHTV